MATSRVALAWVRFRKQYVQDWVHSRVSELNQGCSKKEWKMQGCHPMDTVCQRCQFTKDNNRSRFWRRPLSEAVERMEASNHHRVNPLQARKEVGGERGLQSIRVPLHRD